MPPFFRFISHFPNHFAGRERVREQLYSIGSMTFPRETGGRRNRPDQKVMYMKKFVAMGALALILAACSLQEASAWVNSKFSVGLDYSHQSGGNNFLWGVFRNGQPPACDGPGCFGPYGYPGHAAQGFQGYPYAQGGMMPMNPMAPSAPVAAPVVPPTQPSSSLEYNGFQTVNFPMYYPPNFYVPMNYGR